MLLLLKIYQKRLKLNPVVRYGVDLLDAEIAICDELSVRLNKIQDRRPRER